jgi:hypothetical protein
MSHRNVRRMTIGRIARRNSPPQFFSSLCSAPVHGWRDLFREPAHGCVRAPGGTAWFPIDHASAHYLVSFRQPA